FDAAVAEFKEDLAAAEAMSAAQQIVRAMDARGFSAPDDHLIAALLLTSERIGSGARRWLLGYGEAKVGKLVLPEHGAESDYFDVLHGVSVCAAAIDAPLILAFDQVEAALSAGTERLVTRIVTQACQLAELSPSTGIIFSALAGTFGGTVLPRLHASIGDRIRNPPCPPVHLQAPDLGILRTVVDRRCEALVRRARLAPQPGAGRVMVPTWLIEQHSGQTIRELFREIREYRELCRSLGRFAQASEFGVSRPIPAAPVDDFDKLWENAKDRDAGGSLHLADHERAALFMELAELASDEIVGVARTIVEESDTSKLGTRLVELTFIGPGDDVIERWRVAFTDEPNSRGQFRDQLEEFLNLSGDARPAIIRRRPIPGVKEGAPRSPSDLAKLQAGPAVRRLFDAEGRAAYAPDQDWTRLRQALDFCRQRADAPGFRKWRKERRFLLDAVAIGEMSQLVRPMALHSSTHRDDGGPSSSTTAFEPARDSDPRDTAQLFLGYSPDKKRVVWDLDRTSKPVLHNFGLFVSGDPGPGKRQTMRALVADAIKLGSPVLVFDFEGDYIDADHDKFASDNGLTVLHVHEGLPINPLRLPPRGPSGSQAIEHIFEVAGVLQTSLSLTEAQTAMLRSSMQLAFRNLDVPLREWVDAETTPAPSMSDVIALAKEEHDQASATMVERVEPLVEEGRVPSDADARLSFDALIDGRHIISFAGLPPNDAMKRALAELLLIQVQAYMLRGSPPEALRRMLVLDQARRLGDSDRLIALARQGRAFGVGLILGSQGVDDIVAELSDSLATKLHLFNADARHRRKVVQSTYGNTSSRAARDLLSLLGALRTLDAVLRNQQVAPYERVSIEPYERRKTIEET
ncbi:MAG: DUF87 domain-containing protein, partial [Myxococcota bacterium]